MFLTIKVIEKRSPVNFVKLTEKKPVPDIFKNNVIKKL